MYKIFVSIGSNIDKERNVPSGVHSLEREFGDLKLSPVYESEAVGFTGESFYNMVAGFNSALSPRDIRDLLRDIEQKHQRVRGKNKFESRTLDLDQILYGNKVIDDADLQIPNDDVTDYAFILYPLSDVAGDVIHPVLRKTFSELRDECKSQHKLIKKLDFSEIDQG